MNSLKISLLGGAILSPLLLRCLAASRQYIAEAYRYYFYAQVIPEKMREFVAKAYKQDDYDLVYRDYSQGSALWMHRSSSNPQSDPKIFWIQAPEMIAYELEDPELESSITKKSFLNTFSMNFIERIYLGTSSSSEPIEDTFAADLFLHMLLNDVYYLNQNARLNPEVKTLANNIINKLLDIPIDVPADNLSLHQMLKNLTNWLRGLFQNAQTSPRNINKTINEFFTNKNSLDNSVFSKQTFPPKKEKNEEEEKKSLYEYYYHNLTNEDNSIKIPYTKIDPPFPFQLFVYQPKGKQSPHWKCGYHAIAYV